MRPQPQAPATTRARAPSAPVAPPATRSVRTALPALIDHVVEAPSEKGNLNGETTNNALVTKINSHWMENHNYYFIFHIIVQGLCTSCEIALSTSARTPPFRRDLRLRAVCTPVTSGSAEPCHLWTARLLPVYRSNASWAKVGVHQVLPGRLIEHAREHDLFIVAVARSRSNLRYRLHVGTLDRTAIAPPESKRPCGD